MLLIYYLDIIYEFFNTLVIYLIIYKLLMKSYN
jgi:hypothetical protein